MCCPNIWIDSIRAQVPHPRWIFEGGISEALSNDDFRQSDQFPVDRVDPQGTEVNPLRLNALRYLIRHRDPREHHRDLPIRRETPETQAGLGWFGACLAEGTQLRGASLPRPPKISPRPVNVEGGCRFVDSFLTPFWATRILWLGSS